MKKLGKIQTAAIISLSAFALMVPVGLAQTGGTDQDSRQASRAGKQRGERGAHRGHRGGKMHGMMFKGIDLTEDQKARMKQIGQSFRERNKALHQELRAKRQELHQASEGGTFNETWATQKLTEMASLQAKLMGERFKQRQEMLSVLTAEQKAQLEQKRAEFKAKRAERGMRRGQ